MVAVVLKYYICVFKNFEVLKLKTETDNYQKSYIYLLRSTFGEIKTLRLPQKLSGSGTHRGFPFVDFLTKQDAKVRHLYYVTI